MYVPLLHFYCGVMLILQSVQYPFLIILLTDMIFLVSNIIPDCIMCIGIKNTTTYELLQLKPRVN